MKALEDMTNPELVQAYNALADAANEEHELEIKHVARFEDRAAGIRRCQALAEGIENMRTMSRDLDIPKFLRRPASAVPIHQDPEPELPLRDEPRVVTGSEAAIIKEGDSRWRNWQPTPEHMVRPQRRSFIKQVREEWKRKQDRAVEALTAEVPSLKNASKARRADRVIRIAVAANPHRRGTDSYGFFELMRGGPTIGEFLAKVPRADRKKASHWVFNDARDGYIKLLG